MAGRLAWRVSRCCVTPWRVEDSERRALEIGHDILDRVAVTDLILFRGDIADVGHEQNIVKPCEWVIWR